MKDKEVNLNDKAYEKWADQLNALANGFPRTESGIEIRILKKISTPEEAWLLSQLGRNLESVEEISTRLGLPVTEVKQRLETAARHGAVIVDNSSGVDCYRLKPWIPGLWESSTHIQDQEFAHLSDQYMMLSGILDKVVKVSNEDAIAMRDRLVKEEGLFCGISSGANAYMAVKKSLRNWVLEIT